MCRFLRRLVPFLSREDGPTAVEYAIMLALIVLVCMKGITKVGNKAKTNFNTVSKSLK